MAFEKRILAAAAGAVLALQPAVAAAQQAQCITEDEVSAIAIYSVPSLLQSVRLRCGTQLSASGYLARGSDTLAARYAALQAGVWPKARSGMMKVLASKATGEGRQGLEMITRLPDESVRPVVDALIVQELSPKIAAGDCWKIERIIEAMAPIDPEVAGTLLGAVVGVVQPEQLPVCRASVQ
jgi:hypothetical protein